MGFVMIKAGVFLQDDLSHRVREDAIVCKTDVRFHNRRLAIDAGKDQGPRMSHAWFLTWNRNKDNVNRLANYLTARDVDKRSIIEESGIEGREGVLFIIGEFCKINRRPRVNAATPQEDKILVVGQLGQIRFD